MLLYPCNIITLEFRYPSSGRREESGSTTTVPRVDRGCGCGQQGGKVCGGGIAVCSWCGQLVWLRGEGGTANACVGYAVEYCSRGGLRLQ